MLIRTAYKQSEQCSEQKASAQAAAMVTMMMVTAAENQFSHCQESKQTQHFCVPPVSSFCVYRSSGTRTSYKKYTSKYTIPSAKYEQLFFQRNSGQPFFVPEPGKSKKQRQGISSLPLFQSRNHEASLIVSGNHDSAGIRPDQSCSIFEPDCMVRSAGIALRV